MDDAGLNILLLEDETAHAVAVRRALEDGDTSWTLRVAPTREDFLRQLQVQTPDMVLLDLNLPEGRTLDLLPALQIPRSTPVLILTSHGDEHSAVEAIKAGALDYVVKSPEAFAALPHTIARALREWRLLQEHREAQERLRITLEKYRVLFDMFPLGISIINPQGVITETNREGNRLLDVSRDTHMTRPLQDTAWRMVRPDGTPMPYEEYAAARALRERRPVDNVEMGIVLDDGRIRWLSVTAAPIPLEGHGVAVAFGDITPRKEAERALEQSRQLFESVAHTSPALLWLSDPDKGCTWFNDPWLIFTGRSMGQEVGEGWTEGVHPDDRDRCVATYREAFDARRPFTMEYRLRRHDGVFRWVLDQGHPRFDAAGAFLGYIGSVLDITAQKDVERDLRQTLEDREILLREVHHRVKNNLQIICSLISLKIEAESSPHTRNTLRETLARIRSMGLIHEHLYRQGSFAVIPMGAYTTELARHLQGLFTPSGSVAVTVTVDIPPELKLPLDQAISCGLLLNELVTNALKHAFVPAPPPGQAPRVRIAMERRERFLVLVVEDNGVGFPAPPQDDETYAGSLGMRIVQALTRQLDGTLRFDPGPGCRVVMEFPEGE